MHELSLHFHLHIYQLVCFRLSLTLLKSQRQMTKPSEFLWFQFLCLLQKCHIIIYFRSSHVESLPFVTLGRFMVKISGWQCVLTFPHSGRPGWVLVLSPVMESLFSFLARRSSAICRPMAFMSFLLRADVMYMCISRKRPDRQQSFIRPLILSSLFLSYRSTYLTPSHLLAPRLPGPSQVWSVSWQTIQMTSGLCWSRWSRPAGSNTDAVLTNMLSKAFDELWCVTADPRWGFLTLRSFMSLSLMFSHQE